MALTLYDTLQKKEIPFASKQAGKATVYTCGPTVYGRPHIGNYSSFLMADLLCRWLEAGHGLQVRHVKNITDVGHLVRDADSGEDKIEKQAREEHGTVSQQSVLAIARRYEDEYLADERTLKFREPQERPRASEYVAQMKAMIEVLLTKGHAYATDDGIYFDVTSKTPTPYGSLSGNTLENLSAGARVEVNEGKRHPADFALWKFCVGGNEHHILRWPSPAVPGRASVPEGFPGWHIECSAMSSSLLGEEIDFHTGGEDNIFPHHECEIAQSEAVMGKRPFVRHWLHRRRIDLGAEKMSKSLGNVVSLPTISEWGFSPMDLRYYLLSVHYRTPLKFTKEGLEGAHTARRRIVEWMQVSETWTPTFEATEKPDGSRNERLETMRGHMRAFSEAMDSDLNTPGALAALFETMTASHHVGFWDEQSKKEVRDFIALVRHTFGCFDAETDAIPSDVQALADERSQARASKNFAESDRLRDAIAALGWEVKDTKDGQKLRKL